MTCLLSVLLTGCLEFGKVEQGRVIAYDEERRTFTMIRDTGAVPPEYGVLPASEYLLPEDPSEVGAEPAAGLLMKVDTSSHQLVIFDPATNAFKSIPYTPVALREDVGGRDPEVYDRAEKQKRKFPQIDTAKGTVTVYLRGEKKLVTFSLSPEYLALPEHTWVQGDEVRIYLKQPPKAERFMNVTLTDIYQK